MDAIADTEVLAQLERGPAGSPTDAGSGGGALRGALTQAAPLAVAGLAANAASVVATLLLARLLGGRGYGALTQLTGVFLVVSIPGSAVVVAVVRRVAGTRWSADQVRGWAARVHRRAAVALACFAAVVAAAGPGLAILLGRRDPAGVDVVAIAGGVWVVLCIDRGLLQAHRGYRSLSSNFLVEGGVRAAAMLTFVAAGLGVRGAAMGILVGEAAAAAHGRVVATRAWRRTVSIAGGGTGADLAPGWSLRAELVAALAALAMIALLQNMDVIVVGRARPDMAGAYAAVSVSCKVLVFAALVVGGYLLPEAAIRWRDGAHALRQLAVTLLLLGLPAAALVAIAAGAPSTFLSVLFSGRYVDAAGAFLPLALAMACLGGSVVITMYLLAIGDRRVVWVLGAGAAALTAAVVLADGAPYATALADLAVQAAVIGGLGLDMLAVHSRRYAPRR